MFHVATEAQIDLEMGHRLVISLHNYSEHRKVPEPHTAR
jgi:hypothetical protein